MESGSKLLAPVCSCTAASSMVAGVPLFVQLGPVPAELDHDVLLDVQAPLGILSCLAPLVYLQQHGSGRLLHPAWKDQPNCMTVLPDWYELTPGAADLLSCPPAAVQLACFPFCKV